MRALSLLALGLSLAIGLTACDSSHEETAVLLHVPADPTITFKVWFKVGSQNDPPGKAGLANLTGELLAEGATEDHSYEEILQELYPLASGYSIRVDREMTVLSGRTHKDNLEAYYGLFTGAFLRPAFNEDDFKRIKTNTVNYLKNSLRFAQDEELGKAALYEFVFVGTPYAHPPEGLVESVESLTLDDVKGFYQRYYTAGNAEVALGGGFDEALAARFQGSVDALPPALTPGADAPPPPVIEAAATHGRQLLLVDKPDADASISFGFPIEARRGERDFYALWIANSWLGEHRNSSSHLFQVIRESRGLNYGDYSYIESFPGGGRRSFPPQHVGRNEQIFEVWVRTLPNAQAQFALRAAMRELKSLVDNGMTRESFELTRSFLEKYVLHFAPTTAERLGYAVDDRFYGVDGEGHLARFRRMMSEITLEDVNAAIRKHLQYENVKIAMVTGDAEGLREALVADSPSPMEYASKKSQAILDEDVEISTFPLEIDADSVRVVPLEQMFSGATEKRGEGS
jgi:zinc protease